jgi:hypothetical protein
VRNLRVCFLDLGGVLMAGGELMAGGDLGLDEVVDESGCLEPLFYDEAEVLAEVVAKAERRQREADEKAAEHARNLEEWTRRNAAHQAVLDTFTEYDPKTGEVCYTRFYHKDFSKFDIDEECKSKFQITPHSSI